MANDFVIVNWDGDRVEKPAYATREEAEAEFPRIREEYRDPSQLSGSLTKRQITLSAVRLSAGWHRRTPSSTEWIDNA
jgi:hypothetical protein